MRGMERLKLFLTCLNASNMHVQLKYTGRTKKSVSSEGGKGLIWSLLPLPPLLKV